LKNFYQELSEYTGKSEWLCTQRSLYAPIELAWQWDKFKTDPLKYYKESELYIFDLSMYHTHLQQRGTHQWFIDTLKKYDFKTMLDFGGGIGEYTILAEQNGVKCTYADVGKTAEYAKWRFDKYQIKPTIGDENYKWKTYNCIMAMDVLEHLPDPKPVIKKLAESTDYIFCNPEEIGYNERYPQHISLVDLSPYFKKIDRYLYQKI